LVDGLNRGILRIKEACRRDFMVKTLRVKSGKREEMVDITSQVAHVVSDSGVKEGACYIYVPHTTAGVFINEHADPSVAQDIRETLARLVPYGKGYKHLEGNADAHIKATLVGTSQMVFISGGRFQLGTWQGIFFAEFDGPRTRQVFVKVLEG
jgi:secondary thiamine-phosphate synthase enzyme